MPHSIIVCINSHPRTAVLLRAGQRKARETRQKWSVLYVETPEHYKEDEASRKRVLRFVTQAEEMGAEIVKIQAVDAYEGITHHVAELIEGERKPGHVIVGRVHKEGWWAEWRGALADRVTRALGQRCEIQIIPLGKPVGQSRNWHSMLSIGDVTFKEVFFALSAVLVAFASTELLRLVMPRALFFLNGQNVSIIFLTACAFVAGRYGMVPGLVASVSGFLTINFFYTKPFYKLHFTTVTDALHLALFLLAAILISAFTSYSRAHALAAQTRERRTQALYKISRMATRIFSRGEALAVMHRELHELLEMKVAFFLPKTLKPDELEVAYPESCELTAYSRAALQKCWTQCRTTGNGAMLNQESEWRFEPMVTQEGSQGVLAVHIPTAVRVDASFGKLLSVLADQAAAILERIDLTQSMEAARVSEEKEKLRSMLLSSVSHDLKTPLASIIGSLSVYHSMYDNLPDEQKMTLTHTALDEAQRLDSFISNILDMTRLESGEVKTRQEWHNPVPIVLRVKKRLRQRIRNHKLVMHKPVRPLEAELDMLLMEQVLQNVIDNAAKYAPEETPIDISIEGDERDGLVIQVRDRGPGIPEDMVEKVFNKYERLNKQDTQIAGTGLGLAICRTVMEAMGGSITAGTHPEGGAVFAVNLPHARYVEQTVQEEAASA